MPNYGYYPSPYSGAQVDAAVSAYTYGIYQNPIAFNGGITVNVPISGATYYLAMPNSTYGYMGFSYDAPTSFGGCVLDSTGFYFRFGSGSGADAWGTWVSGFSAGVSLGYVNSTGSGVNIAVSGGSLTVNTQPVALMSDLVLPVVTSGAALISSSVLSGGTSYVYDSVTPVTSIVFGSITSDCRAQFKFTAGATVTMGFPAGCGFAGVSAPESGSSYILAVNQQDIVVVPYTETPLA